MTVPNSLVVIWPVTPRCQYYIDKQHCVGSAEIMGGAAASRNRGGQPARPTASQAATTKCVDRLDIHWGTGHDIESEAVLTITIFVLFDNIKSANW